MTLSPDAPSLKYAGFISYSRKDAKWAKKIQRALEGYRLPIKVDEDGRPKKTLGKFFRDEDELAGAPSLGATLRGALEDSKALIVVCSPNAAGSEWVDQEIRHFKAKRPGAPVFGVIVEGKPEAADPDQRCFPEALVRKVGADGNLTEVRDEPLAPDATTEPFLRVKTRLAAGLIGVGFDELWKREQRRQRTRRITGLAATLAVLAGGSFGFSQYLDRAREAARVTLMQSADKRSREALAAFQTGDRRQAFILAASALPDNVPSEFRDEFQDNLLALDEVHNTRVVKLPVTEPVMPTFSPDGRLVVTVGHLISANGSSNASTFKEGVRVWDATTGSLVQELLPPKSVVENMGTIPVAFSPDSRFLAVAAEKRINGINRTGKIYVWNTATWERVLDVKASASFLTFNGVSDVLQSSEQLSADYFWDLENGAFLGRLPHSGCGMRQALKNADQEFFILANFSYDGKCQGPDAAGVLKFDPKTKNFTRLQDLDVNMLGAQAIVASRYLPVRKKNNGIAVMDIESGQITDVVDREFPMMGLSAIVVHDGRRIVVTASLEGDVDYFDLDQRKKVKDPFGHAIKMRMDAVVYGKRKERVLQDYMPSMATDQAAQVHWKRATVVDWDDLETILSEQPADWQQEIADRRLNFAPLSVFDLLF